LGISWQVLAAPGHCWQKEHAACRRAGIREDCQELPGAASKRQPSLQTAL
jgi:hypothetical protein